MKTVETGCCFLCGNDSLFIIEESAILFREAKCICCGASKRNSDVAKTIVSTYGGKGSLQELIHLLGHLRIYDTQSSGPIYDILSKLPSYICSEFFNDIASGSYKNGIRCEDIGNLSFPDNYFDLVITQDVLEHVEDPYQAFKEIKRVLIPNGFHIFTVPFHEGQPTIRRIIKQEKGYAYYKPIVYHGDPLREIGSLVFTDFGEDMVEDLEIMNFQTESIMYSRWYEQGEISKIDDDKEYNEYIKKYKSKNLENYFKYNSIVFRSKKKQD